MNWAWTGDQHGSSVSELGTSIYLRVTEMIKRSRDHTETSLQHSRSQALHPYTRIRSLIASARDSWESKIYLTGSKSRRWLANWYILRRDSGDNSLTVPLRDATRPLILSRLGIHNSAYRYYFVFNAPTHPVLIVLQMVQRDSNVGHSPLILRQKW